jgi:hypothetical protein
MVRFPALSVGHALNVDAAGVGVVHSVFERAVNVLAGQDLWTLLSADRSDLPFGIRIAAWDFDAIGLRRGDRVEFRAGFVRIGSEPERLLIDCRSTPQWIPTRRVTPAAGLAERLEVVAAAAAPRAWHGSQRMACALTSALNERDVLTSVLPGVVGCGPGATPSGDDLLVGILAVLGSPHSGARGAAAAHSLRRALLPLLPTTTDISAHLLRQAGSGLFARWVHELVCTLIGDPAPGRVLDAARRVIDAGASSGADMCMGLLACARSFLPIGRRPEARFEPINFHEAA